MRTGMLALETVRQITIPSGSDFPLLIQPSVQGYELEAWLREHTQTVWNLVARHGALLFRGFRVGSAVHFERAVLALAPALQEEYGDLPRAVTSTRFVQDATPYPSRYAILFHHEASQTPNWPEHMWFYCETPAVAGGETPLVASDEIWQRLPSVLRTAFTERGLCYLRTFVPGLDVPWQQYFGSDDPRVVEVHCRDLGIVCQWQSDGGLKTVTRRPAVMRHPRRGSHVFFNQILLHHPACLDPNTRAALIDLLGADNLPRSVSFGDGTSISDAMVEELLGIMVEASVCFVWEADDVLMIDNVAVAHARRPYQGPRCIRVALSPFVGDERL